MASEQGQHRITIATVLGTVWTRILAALTGVALILGIVAEVISIVTGYYTMQKAAADADIAKANAKAATATAVLPGQLHDSMLNRRLDPATCARLKALGKPNDEACNDNAPPNDDEAALVAKNKHRGWKTE